MSVNSQWCLLVADGRASLITFPTLTLTPVIMASTRSLAAWPDLFPKQIKLEPTGNGLVGEEVRTDDHVLEKQFRHCSSLALSLPYCRWVFAGSRNARLTSGRITSICVSVDLARSPVFPVGRPGDVDRMELPDSWRSQVTRPPICTWEHPRSQLIAEHNDTVKHVVVLYQSI
jgi:hypothetical protein